MKQLATRPGDVRIRKAVLSLSIGLVAALIGTGSAFAGEITGNGKPTSGPENSNSECSFSGQDDPDPDLFGRTQNWGQIPKEGEGGRDFLRSIGVSPGTACNGHLNPQK